ncbi:DegT/DnrJ/EryC1/StrS aminotransferase family protein [Neorhizobium lilium]|uniref:DegT/DnrJ/EryC1/StrS aminotransferase family protein n=1 Tax=Neorhizobium lilium TaxID=2503024 RepID=A0A444LB80_9HYPH|nr:DegT/DnrJ/EryC1/StrS family aminotransferase [Neorhizobium lilium]RWX74837.1 DegT/DnrJ/EryC1/StrS aminotransferase family protein [Neorhizobium lilium]
MNKHVSFNSDASARSLRSIDTSVALFGGTPVIAPGRVTLWPAAKRKHLKALASVVESGKYHRVNHPLVTELEGRLAEWSGGLSVRAVGSGTAAVHVALDYYKDRGHHIVTSALNWPGAVGPISISGLEPIFVDVEPRLAGMDDKSASGLLEPDVAGVLITHLFGNNILAPNLRAAARAKGVALVDDVCQSIGAVRGIVGGSHLDTDVLALSGNGAKHLGAGELGFVLTRDPNLIDHVDEVSLTSSSRNGARIFSPNSKGYNYRPNVFSASIANYRLKHLDQQLEKRRNNAFLLWREIGQLPGLAPLFDPSDRHQSMLNFPLRIEPEQLGFPSGPVARDFIIKLLQAEGVPVWVWLTKPVFEYLPDVRGKWSKADFPNAMRLLDTMFYVSEIAPPNDAEIMKLYAAAFHKIWAALPNLISKIPDGVAAA